ncbi:MAG: hypothetical protein R6X31_13850 [Anaerolineae bacterium]
MTKGIVLTGADKHLEELAGGKGLNVTTDSEMGLAYDKTLFVEPGGEVPWDLLPAAWHLLERWDAAVPMWRYGVNASDVGTKAERERTKAVVRDLRVLLHSVELLFVRDNKNGQALMDAYRDELENGGEKRLAFLRAHYRTKPRLCVLPRPWLAKVFERSKMDARSARGGRRTGAKLVTVEVAPGRFVKCNPGDEEKVIEMFTGGRRG